MVEGKGDTYKSNHLNIPLLKLALQFRKRTQFGRTNGCEIRRVGEENRPSKLHHQHISLHVSKNPNGVGQMTFQNSLSTQPFVKIDISLSGLCLEVGSFGTKA